MKNRRLTGMVLSLILILLFLISFYNFLAVRSKEREMDEQKLVKELLRQGEISDQEEPNRDFGKQKVSGTEKITDKTILKLVLSEDLDKRNMVNVKMNSACFEMDFSQFQRYLKEHVNEVLTDQVYILKKDFDPRLDSVTILSFGTQDVVLGISCGQTRYGEIKTGFDYFGIVDNEELYVYLMSNDQSGRSIYMKSALTEYNFPVEVQESLENGMFFQDEKELYNFLESYSS